MSRKSPIRVRDHILQNLPQVCTQAGKDEKQVVLTYPFYNAEGATRFNRLEESALVHTFHWYTHITSSYHTSNEKSVHMYRMQLQMSY